MMTHLGIALSTFMVTNIDDLLILSIYFASPDYKKQSIILGQYLGITSLIVISLTGLIIGNILEPHWVSLLGLLPFLLGIKDLLGLLKKDEADDEPAAKRSQWPFLHVALVTIANGGDNIGVYAPLFAHVNKMQIPLYVITWLVLTACWCALAFAVVKHPRIKMLFARFGKLILPVFLILLGSWIMSDFITWLFLN
ncbi:MAG: transporter [Cytophaga sp.]|nr:transporter [Cytophaga sp.]